MGTLNIVGVFAGAGQINRPPAINIASQWFDGTISGNELVDKIGGKNLDIINKDFPDYWQKGLPYKSASFVAQKASTFGLIPNPNYFWFKSDGTPNQIPICCLFNNIDYGNQIFCLRKDPSYDISYLETWEGRVGDIITYSNPLTDNDLVKANNYFKVPILDLTAKWVDPVNGIDTNAGTYLAPFLTYSKIRSFTNTNFYIKSGVLNINTNQTISSNKVYGIGNSQLKSNVVGDYYSTPFNCTFKGLFLNANGISNSHFTTNNAVGNNMIFKNCYFGNSLKNAYWNNTTSSIFDSCVLTGGSAGNEYVTSYSNCTIRSTFINFLSSVLISTNSAQSVEVSSNNISCRTAGTLISKKQNSSISIINNFFNNTKFIFSTVNKNSTTGDSTIKNNRGTIEGASVYFTNGNVASSGTDYFLNNNIKAIGGTVVFNSVRNSVVSNNTLIGDSLDLIYSYPEVGYLSEIESNYLEQKANNAYCLTGTGHVKFNKNTLYSSILNSGQHGFQAYNCTTSEINYNKVENVHLGLITKNAYGYTSLSNTISYNVLTNSLILSKGASNTDVYHNTSNCNGFDYCISFIENADYANIQHQVNSKCLNNISINTTIECINIRPNQDVVADNSIVYNTISTKIRYSNINYTLLGIQSLGLCLNSSEANPNIKLNSELWPTTPITIGQNLGTTYEDGLDILSVWPNIITKKQPNIGNWQIGAYVQ